MTTDLDLILEIKNLTKLYKNGRGVRDISLTLAPGEVLGLLGPNGSGKTTTMKAIVGLVFPQSGDINVCKTDALKYHERAMQNVGALIEAPALYNYLTAEQNLMLAARFYKNKSDDSISAETEIDQALRLVGMDKYKKERVRSFSLGMRQRVGLACALISKPRLLILDEPANGLDIEGMLYVREVVKTISENGSAVLISSHLANEIQQYANKAAVMHNGALLGLDTMDTILESHNDLESYFLHKVRQVVSGSSSDTVKREKEAERG